MKRLVVVESPTKARTIRAFLPEDGFRVEASMGHIRDLPASADQIPSEYKDEDWARLGVKVTNGFEPLYIVPPDKRDVVRDLRRALADADVLYIATDEDREGESIGWHLVNTLDPSVPVERMVFHEITEDAIRRALEETRDIDEHLVEAQQTRRILDFALALAQDQAEAVGRSRAKRGGAAPGAPGSGAHHVCAGHLLGS